MYAQRLLAVSIKIKNEVASVLHAAFFIYPYSYFNIKKDSFIAFTGAHLNRHIYLIIIIVYICLKTSYISVVNHFSVNILFLK